LHYKIREKGKNEKAFPHKEWEPSGGHWRTEKGLFHHGFAESCSKKKGQESNFGRYKTYSKHPSLGGKKKKDFGRGGPSSPPEDRALETRVGENENKKTEGGGGGWKRGLAERGSNHGKKGDAGDTCTGKQPCWANGGPFWRRGEKGVKMSGANQTISSNHRERGEAGRAKRVG